MARDVDQYLLLLAFGLELVSLVHAMHGHPGIEATLTLLRERFFWPTMTRDARHLLIARAVYLMSHEETFKKSADLILPGRAIQPQVVVEIELMIVGVDRVLVAGNRYLLLVVDKASRFPST